MATSTRLPDLEASTRSKLPAYRYLREADRIPPIHATSCANGSAGPMAIVKLFDPTGSWTWYVAQYDRESRLAWGVVDGDAKEYGYFDMAELVGLRGRFRLPLERDLHWTPQPLSELVP